MLPVVGAVWAYPAVRLSRRKVQALLEGRFPPLAHPSVALYVPETWEEPNLYPSGFRLDCADDSVTVETDRERECELRDILPIRKMETDIVVPGLASDENGYSRMTCFASAH